jgi:hypothetical protein
LTAISRHINIPPNLEDALVKFVFPALLTTICLTSGLLWADESWPPALETIVRSIDLNVGESGEV